jgi:hypothetical protein
VNTPEKSIVEIKRSHDPAGRSGLVGVSAGYNFENAARKIALHYPGKSGREYFLTADYFDLETPKYLLIYCPQCQNTLRIAEDNKRIEFEPEGRPKFGSYREEAVLAGLELSSYGGLLSVESFGCTWELEPTLRRNFGLATCNWRVVIEKNVIRDI